MLDKKNNAPLFIAKGLKEDNQGNGEEVFLEFNSVDEVMDTVLLTSNTKIIDIYKRASNCKYEKISMQQLILDYVPRRARV